MSNTTDNAAIRQSMSLVDMTKPLCDDLMGKIEALYTNEELKTFNRVILTGCGDSLVAGIAAKEAFEQIAGVRVEAVPTSQLCYYYGEDKFTWSPLAIGVSISGKAAGTAAAMQHCRNNGVETLGITESLETDLAQVVDKVLKHNAPEAELAPGTKTYFTSVLSLLLMAIHMGVVRGRICEDTKAKYIAEMIEYTEGFRPIMETLAAQTKEIASAWKPYNHYDCVGSGVDFASAWFVRAKIYEAFGKLCACENTEDWLHVNYWARNTTEIATILYITDANPARSRAMEAAGTMAHIGRPTVVVTDIDPKEFPEGLNIVSIPKAAHLWMAPLMNFMPMTLMCGYLQDVHGEKPLRGIEGVWAEGKRNMIYTDQSEQLDWFKKEAK